MVLLATLLAFAPPAAAADATLDVATLNTWGLPFPVAKHRARRMPEIAEYLDDESFDVVGLQEVWKGARRWWDRDDVLLASRDRGDTGLALATPHPVDAQQVVHFSAARGPDKLKHKGVLRSRVHLPGRRDLWTLVTHLQAGNGDRAATVRADQVSELLRVLGDVDGPVLVLGDFNLSDSAIDRDTEARLLAAGLVDAGESADEPTYRGGNHRLDRVFVRSGGDVDLVPVGATVVQYGDDLPELSDHLPVSVRLAWEATPP